MTHVIQIAADHPDWFGVFKSLAENIRRVFKQREVFERTYSELNRLTDRQLADINLHRSMIADAAREVARKA